ncbi:MAG: DoxX family membrane protein [Saprospiraceae bacterium]|nr:DoxX family membrane protein [Saprospiraceae bacterium]
MRLTDFYALLIRLLLGYVFLSSGLCKLSDGHFGQLIGPPLLIRQLEQYQLGLFGYFVAISQVLVGALVLSQRWSLLGLVMLVPMNVSIMAVTISQQWTGTPYVNGFFLALNLLALAYEWPSLRFFLIPESTPAGLPTRTHQLFPGFWKPVAVLALALLGVVAAPFSLPTTLAAGVSAMIAAWWNVWRPERMSWPILATLGASLLAVTTLSMAEPLTRVKINVHIPVLTGLMIAFLGAVVTTLMKRR